MSLVRSVRSSGALLLVVGLSLCGHPASADSTFVSGEIIVILNAGHSIDQVNATWGTTTLDSLPASPLYLVFAEGVEELEDYADDMTEDPAVDIAEANYYEESPEGIREMVIFAVGGTYGDYEDQALTERIGLDAAHTVSRGAGVTVGILDSGIDPTHEAFLGRIAPNGYDFVDGDSEPWEVANGQDDDGDSLIDEGFGHGSMVAGIFALVAPEADLLPIRVLDDEGRGDAWTVVKGIHFAVDAGVTAMNLSFGVPMEVSPIGRQIEYAYTSGVIVVAGAGNEDRASPPYFPAAHSESFMVTALDSLDIKAGFADYNEHVIISAPGTGVRSAYPGNDWAIGSGCSFATPFVTGEVALLLSLDPTLSWDQMEEIIEEGVDPIYDIPENAPYDEMLGRGRIYLPAAVGNLATGVPDGRSARPPIVAYPNPSSGIVWLRSPIGPDISPDEFAIYDASGRLVVQLSAAGSRPLMWDGCDTSGQKVSPGVYFVRPSSQSEARHKGATLSILR